MCETHQSLLSAEVKSEYKKIDDKWLLIHYRIFRDLIIFAFLFETIGAIAYYCYGSVFISMDVYLLKYLLAPTIINGLCLLFGRWLVKGTNLTFRKKTFILSTLLVVASFIFFTVHIIFTSLYLVFFIPIMLTIVYSDYVLTAVTTAASVVLKTISELFIVWDPDKINPFDNEIGITNFAVSTLLLLIIYIISINIIRFEKKKREAAINKEITHYETKQKLKIDEVTNVFTRHQLRETFESIKADKDKNSYILAMADLDDFKALNDKFGHAKGDEILTRFGSILKKNCKENVTPFRYGGDEFCIVFKNKSNADVLTICDNIQRDLKNEKINKEISKPITVSIGIAGYKKGITIKDWLQLSDKALYDAKRSKGSVSVFE